jgi:hypothetical protein
LVRSMLIGNLHVVAVSLFWVIMSLWHSNSAITARRTPLSHLMCRQTAFGTEKSPSNRVVSLHVSFCFHTRYALNIGCCIVQKLAKGKPVKAIILGFLSAVLSILLMRGPSWSCFPLLLQHEEALAAVAQTMRLSESLTWTGISDKRFFFYMSISVKSSMTLRQRGASTCVPPRSTRRLLFQDECRVGCPLSKENASYDRVSHS